MKSVAKVLVRLLLCTYVLSTAALAAKPATTKPSTRAITDKTPQGFSQFFHEKKSVLYQLTLLENPQSPQKFEVGIQILNVEQDSMTVELKLTAPESSPIPIEVWQQFKVAQEPSGALTIKEAYLLSPLTGQTERLDLSKIKGRHLNLLKDILSTRMAFEPQLKAATAGQKTFGAFTGSVRHAELKTHTPPVEGEFSKGFGPLDLVKLIVYKNGGESPAIESMLEPKESNTAFSQKIQASRARPASAMTESILKMIKM